MTTKTCSRMTTDTTFSRQNDADSPSSKEISFSQSSSSYWLFTWREGREEDPSTVKILEGVTSFRLVYSVPAEISVRVVPKYRRIEKGLKSLKMAGGKNKQNAS